MFKICQRDIFLKLKNLLFPILGIVFALIIMAIFMFFIKINPLEAYKILLKGSLGSKYALSETLVKATPILFTGLGYALAFKCGLFNIGGEGQFYMGGLGATLAALFLPSFPNWLCLPMALLLGFIMGGILCAIPGLLKAWRGVNETITTIMFVYIGIYFVNFMVSGPIKEPGYFPQSPLIPKNAILSSISMSNTRLTTAFPLVLIFLFLYYILFYRTSLGLKIRIVGSNPTAAEYLGINRKVMIIFVMFLSGGSAGLGGATEILGIQGRLIENFSPGYGWDGISVALVGRAHPIGMLFTAFLFGMLRSGGRAMQRQTGAPIAIVYVIQAIILIFTVAGTYIKQRKTFFKQGKIKNKKIEEV